MHCRYFKNMNQSLLICFYAYNICCYFLLLTRSLLSKRSKDRPGHKLERGVIVNLMCQLGWVTVLRNEVKHFSGCFCESNIDCPS